MAEPSSTSIERAFGNVYVVANGVKTRNLPKLEPLQNNPQEQLYLALTYVFDLQRKFEYVCKVLEEFAPFADPNLARRIRDEDAQLNDTNLSWAQRAPLAEQFMQDLYNNVVGTEHDRQLNLLSQQSTGSWP